MTPPLHRSSVQPEVVRVEVRPSCRAAVPALDFEDSHRRGYSVEEFPQHRFIDDVLAVGPGLELCDVLLGQFR
jgi:hypothetical protein